MFYTGSLGTVSTSEDWSFTFDVIDTGGADVDISSAAISFAVRAKNSTTPSLEKTVGDGITVSTPSFTVLIDVSETSALAIGEYDVGCTVEIASLTTQLFVMKLTVVDGIVST
jgi:hypothetical protein